MEIKEHYAVIRLVPQDVFHFLLQLLNMFILFCGLCSGFTAALLRGALHCPCPLQTFIKDYRSGSGALGRDPTHLKHHDTYGNNFSWVHAASAIQQHA